MAVVLGVSAGFVTTAPTADPNGDGSIADDRAKALKVTSPSGSNKIIEIGFYASLVSTTTNFEVGIYSHDSGNNRPDTLLYSNTVNALSGSVGWQVSSGLDFDMTSETIYWIGLQIDDTNQVNIDYAATGGYRALKNPSQTELTNPWGTGDFEGTRLLALYALIEAPTGVTRKIKISGTFQDKPIKEKKAGTFEDKPIKIKVGGTFQDA